jgi:hypothetical protein
LVVARCRQTRTSEPLTERLFDPDIPLRWDVMKVLHSDPLLEKVDDNTILMSTNRDGV